MCVCVIGLLCVKKRSNIGSTLTHPLKREGRISTGFFDFLWINQRERLWGCTLDGTDRLTSHPCFSTPHPYLVTPHPYFVTPHPHFSMTQPTFLCHTPTLLRHTSTLIRKLSYFATPHPYFSTPHPYFLLRHPYLATLHRFKLHHISAYPIANSLLTMPQSHPHLATYPYIETSSPLLSFAKTLLLSSATPTPNLRCDTTS